MSPSRQMGDLKNASTAMTKRNEWTKEEPIAPARKSIQVHR